MNVVVVHNHYQQPGGEDQVFAAESALLEEAGISVTRYAVHNDSLTGKGGVALAMDAVWSATQYRELRSLFRRVRPDIVHVHNTLPIISPAVYDAAREENGAVVQTLHNYRLMCPSGLLFRDGAPCEACVGKAVQWPAIKHACYRGSRRASGVVAASNALHRLRRTYLRKVDRFIALTEFAKERFVAGGLPETRIRVKPNFVAPDPGPGRGRGAYALFVGRLSHEKGLDVLLQAWCRIGSKLPLRIVGDGPMAQEVDRWAAAIDGVSVLGRLASAEVRDQMKDASVLVAPSMSYETFGLVAVEALAVGTPVIASRLGALAEVVAHRRTGLLFKAGDSLDLEAAIQWVLENPAAYDVMRAEARNEYLAKYTAERNLVELLGIYRQAREQAPWRSR